MGRRSLVSLVCLTLLFGCSSEADEGIERRPTLDAAVDVSLDGGGIEPGEAQDSEDDTSNSGDIGESNDAGANDAGSTDAGSDAASDIESDVPAVDVSDTASDAATDTAPDSASDVIVPDANPSDANPPDADTEDTPVDSPIYQGSGDPFIPGPLRFSSGAFEEGREGAPVPFLILVPLGDGPYPVVVFQHGFLLANSYYSQLLEHLASHGFVVIAPQMYPSAILPIGQPSTPEETALASTFYRWLDDNLVAIAGPSVEESVVGLVGHSRGGKVIWGFLQAYDNAVSAVAGVDPVDGEGGPLGGEDRVLEGPANLGIPSLIIGTGLGSESSFTSPACAPEGDNHVQFYGASASPAWHVVVPDYGHNDMLDDDPAGCFVTCTACLAGDARAPMRATTAGALVAFFRGALQGNPSAYETLLDVAAMPAPVVVESR